MSISLKRNFSKTLVGFCDMVTQLILSEVPVLDGFHLSTEADLVQLLSPIKGQERIVEEG